MSLTGNIRFRKNVFGKIVLRVEEKYILTENYGVNIEVEEAIRWRDANEDDLYELRIKAELNHDEKGE